MIRFLLVVLLAAVAPDRLEIEGQIRTLQAERDSRMGAKDWDGVLEVSRRMSAVDPEHPQIFLGLVLMSARQGKLASAGRSPSSQTKEPAGAARGVVERAKSI